jgi:hypothetical protein
MLLLEHVDAFKRKYKFECLKRNTAYRPDLLDDPFLALLLSEIVGDIQKTFGVIQLSTTIPVVIGTDKYNLSSSAMEIENAVIGTTTLTKKTPDWMQKRISQNGSPEFYTLLYQSAIPQIWVYPNPSATTDSLIVYYKPNFNFYSPSSTAAGDFGDFYITNQTFAGNTVFPTQYDKLMMLGFLKQIFPDIQAEYEKEKSLLLVKQFNGEKFDYDPEWGE